MANNKLHSWIKNIRMEWGFDSLAAISRLTKPLRIQQHRRSRQHAQQLQRLDARRPPSLRYGS